MMMPMVVPSHRPKPILTLKGHIREIAVSLDDPVKWEIYRNLQLSMGWLPLSHWAAFHFAKCQMARGSKVICLWLLLVVDGV